MGRGNSISQQNNLDRSVPLCRSVPMVKTQQIGSCQPERVISPNSLKKKGFQRPQPEFIT